MEKPNGITLRDSIGYLLLIIGLLIIVVSLFNAYSLLSGKSKPSQLFSLPGISVDLTKSITAQLPQTQQNLPASKQEELFPAQSVNEPLNLFTHLFFLGFFVTAGAKIAGIGIDMTRPYVIKAPSKPPQV